MGTDLTRFDDSMAPFPEGQVKTILGKMQIFLAAEA
jgi:hypothetical protein